jgi:hypothetical protein
MSLQDRIQSSTIVGEDSSNPLSVVYDDVSGHLQIDYSSYYNRIATAFETVASNSTAIKNAIETVASNSTAIKNSLSTIAEKQTAIETYQKKLKELGEGNGIRVVGPYEIVQFINTYRILVEEGRILGWRENMPSDKDIAKTLNDLGKYIEKIKQNIPKEF